MIIKGIRRGRDQGGMACGPVEDAVNAELIVQDDRGLLHFVLVSRFMDFYRVMVSPASFFDTLMLISSDGLDVDAACHTMEKISDECYDFEGDNCPDALMQSDFLAAIRLAFHAADACDPCGAECSEGASSFISAYLDADLSAVPRFPLPWESGPVHIL